jgi:hypothetical protein
MGIFGDRSGYRQLRPARMRFWSRCLGSRVRYLAVLVIVFLAATVSARADIQNGLVLHLTFDGDVSDHTGRGNDGTIVQPGADSPYVSGVIGQAYRTQGMVQGIDSSTSSYIALGNPPDLKFGGSTPTDFTVSWWGMYNASAQHDDIPWISNKDWNSGGNRGWILSSEPSGRLRWNFRARGENRKDIPSYVPPLGGLDDGQWHHYVAIFTRGDGGTVTIYIDGLAIDTQPTSSSLDVDVPYLPTNLFQDGTGTYTDIGSGANFDDASMDDLGIWRRALTDDEVGLIYTQGLQGVSALDPKP